MEREDKETMYEDFVCLVKKHKWFWAATSHAQTHPNRIDYSAILKWQYDKNNDELFSITANGNRIIASKNMPAFHIYT